MSDITDKIEIIRKKELERQLFLEVLGSQSGLEVLAWIGNECGAWAQDTQAIRPELVALWNRLLGMMGIVRGDNLFELASHISQAANYEDLMDERRRCNQ